MRVSSIPSPVRVLPADFEGGRRERGAVILARRVPLIAVVGVASKATVEEVSILEDKFSW